MQLPTSVSAFSPSQNPSRPAPSVNQRQSTNSDTDNSARQSSRVQAERQPEAPTEQPAQERVDRVEASRQAELPQQDIATREQQPDSKNPSVNQYQQIAREGANNAQAQDPSLFRVDVYV